MPPGVAEVTHLMCGLYTNYSAPLPDNLERRLQVVAYQLSVVLETHNRPNPNPDPHLTLTLTPTLHSTAQPPCYANSLRGSPRRSDALWPMRWGRICRIFSRREPAC